MSKLGVFGSWLILALMLLININIATSTHSNCDCKDVEGSFIVTRLWNIESDSGLTPQDVIDEFESGFAPIVTILDGFQEYLSAFTGDDSTVFFFNIFETEQQAAAAQNAAVQFVKQSCVLNGKITPNQFTQNSLSFHFSSEKCITQSIKGKYLSTRQWTLTEGSTFDTQGVVDEFKNGFAPQIQEAQGFMEYGGAVVTGTNMTFFYNVFEDAAGAALANTAAAQFVTDGALNGNIEKVVFTEGLIGFDYIFINEKKQNMHYALNDKKEKLDFTFNNDNDDGDENGLESENGKSYNINLNLNMGNNALINLWGLVIGCALLNFLVFFCFWRRNKKKEVNFVQSEV